MKSILKKHILFLTIKILLLFFFYGTKVVLGQQPYFKPVILNSALNQAKINTVFQDNQGLIWVGTSQGVSEFDGNNVNQVKLPDTLLSKNVRSIYQDKNDLYWFGFDNGILLKFDGFETFTNTILENSSAITSIIENKNGMLWIGTYGNGVFLKSPDSLFHINSASGLSDDYVYCLLDDKKGSVWIGTDNGISICFPENDSIVIKTLTVEDGLPDFIVKSLEKDNLGNIWIGMEDEGLCYFNPAENTFVLPEALGDWQYGSVQSIISLDDRIWIAASGDGIVEFFPNRNYLELYDQYQNTNLSRINSFLHDKEGNVWLVSNQEICLSFGNKLGFLKSYDNNPVNNIHALTVDKEDIIWFANDRGLFSYNPYNNPNENRIKSYKLAIDLKKQKILSLYRDKFNYLWIGTFGQGVIRLDPENGSQKIFDETDGLVNGNVLSITGNEKEIWFGTLGGASRCFLNSNFHNIYFIPEFENFGKDEGLVNNFIYQVHLSEKGIPYFATDGNGSVYFEDGLFKNIGDQADFSDKIIYSITTDPYNNVWTNVANDGLYNFVGKQILKISNDDDHKNLSFSGLFSIIDELVIVYDEGIDILNIQSGNIKHFEENAGLEAINPDLNTLAKDSKNNVWVGTSSSLVKYSPSNKEYWDQPVTILDKVSLFLEPLDHNRTKFFSHDQNHLSFDYSGLWYQYPERVEYLLKLEGNDIEWIKTKNNRAVYSDLKPGKYKFRVKAGLYDNFPESNEAVYQFEIKQAFYNTIWFYVIIILILFSLVFIFIKLRIRQIKLKEERIQENIRFQFENLKSQINPHFLFNSFSTLIALIEVDSKTAVTYVEELSTLFRNILEFKDEDVISLDKELEIAENYINIQRKRFGDNLNFDIKHSEEFKNIKIPPLTLQLLMENAIKHNVVSKTKPLFIKIYCDEINASIFVENNRQDKTEDITSTGIGIKNIINRYKLLSDKKVEVIKSNEVFKVKLPYLK